MQQLPSSTSKSQLSSDPPKQRVREVQQLKSRQEREQVKLKDQHKKKHHQQQHRKHLLHQIAKKKKELLQLQQTATQQREISNPAEANARNKDQKDRIRKVEEQLEQQLHREEAKQRERNALDWLRKLEQQRNAAQTQAQTLRKNHSQTMHRNRKEAEHNASRIKESHKEAQRRNKIITQQQLTQYLHGLHSHGIHRKTTTSASLTHIVVQPQRQGITATAQAQKRQKDLVERQRRESQKDRLNREKALQRGEEALARIQRQREYEHYCCEERQNQIDFNKDRISAGVKNQYAGVKPMTMGQMQKNKEARAEEEFEQMFFKGKKIQNTQPLTKFKAVENKMKECPKKKTKAKKKKGPIDYREEESRLPETSHGHYSFEEEQDWEEQGEVPREEKPIPREVFIQREEEIKPIMKQDPFSKTNGLKKTRIPGISGAREELDDSPQLEESLQDSNF